MVAMWLRMLGTEKHALLKCTALSVAVPSFVPVQPARPKLNMARQNDWDSTDARGVVPTTMAALNRKAGHCIHLFKLEQRLSVIALENEGECGHGGRGPEGTSNLCPQAVLRHLTMQAHANILILLLVPNYEKGNGRACGSRDPRKRELRLGERKE